MARNKTIIIIKGRKQHHSQHHLTQNHAKYGRHAPDCIGSHCDMCGYCLNKNYYFKNTWRFIGKKFCYRCIRKVNQV